MDKDDHLMWLTQPAENAPELDAEQRFWKELIREGRWTNLAAGFTLDVDRARLERWLANFEAMTDAGIRVPVPWGHSYDPRDNAGFVEELELRDGALWGLLNVAGADDADRLGRTVCGVSVSVNPDFVDGTGREWGEVIEHVALTNYPVVTDQGEFVQAGAAGRDGRPAITLELVTAGPSHDDQTANPKCETRSAKQISNDKHQITNKDQVPNDKTQTPEPDEEGSDPALRSSEFDVPRSAFASQHPASGGELETRLYLLELERAERDVDEALRAGKFTRPAAEALRRLLATGVERRYAFGRESGGPPDPEPDDDGANVAALARAVIANTPAGAAVDMAEHTVVHPVPEPGAGMTEGRAAQLARENKKLAGV
ncbi:MAG: hypothetical protein ACOC8E_06490 [Planctomycetota bacterium]